MTLTSILGQEQCLRANPHELDLCGGSVHLGEQRTAQRLTEPPAHATLYTVCLDHVKLVNISKHKDILIS